MGHLWRPRIRPLGLPPHTGLHSLRHYYASLLIRHGESIKTVQARLGHATATETLDTYSHLWPDSDDRPREAIDSVLGDIGEDDGGEILADCLPTADLLTGRFRRSEGVERTGWPVGRVRRPRTLPSSEIRPLGL